MCQLIITFFSFQTDPKSCLMVIFGHFLRYQTFHFFKAMTSLVCDNFEE